MPALLLALALGTSLAMTPSETPAQALHPLPPGYNRRTVVPNSRCEVYQGLDAAICQEFIDYPVYLEPTETQQGIVNLYSLYDDFLASQSVTNPECSRLGRTLLCATKWAPCITIESSSTPVFQAVCQKNCNATFEQCALTVPAELLQSSALSLCSTLALNGTVWEPTGFSLECRADLEKSAAELLCPDTLAPCRHNSSLCCPVCPATLFESPEEDFLQTWIQVTAWVSLFASAICVATWTLIPEKRIFPSSLILWMVICTLGVSVALSISLAGPSNVHCEDDVTPASRTNAGCFFQSVMFQFFFLGAACWWFCFAINVTSLLVRNISMKDQLSYFHAFSWGLPGILTFASIVSDSIAYSPNSRFCFLKDKSAEQVGLFFFWLGAIGLIGSGMMIRAIAEIVDVTRRVAEAREGKTGLSAVPLRTVVFVVGYLVVIVFYFFYSMVTLGLNDQINQAQVDYIDCLLSVREFQYYWPNGTYLGTDLAVIYPIIISEGLLTQDLIRVFDSNCVRKPPISFSIVVVNTTLIALVGLWVFLLFVATAENVVLWKRLITGTLNTLQQPSLRALGSSGNLKQHSSPSSPRAPRSPQPASTARGVTSSGGTSIDDGDTELKIIAGPALDQTSNRPSTRPPPPPEQLA